jgi:hypothetical protein
MAHNPKRSAAKIDVQGFVRLPNGGVVQQVPFAGVTVREMQEPAMEGIFEPIGPH